MHKIIIRGMRHSIKTLDIPSTVYKKIAKCWSITKAKNEITEESTILENLNLL